jgi:hypothetical protein
MLNDRPHLLVRIAIDGDHFPFRSVDPLIRIAIGRETYVGQLFAEVAPDQSKIIGYFPVDVPKGSIEFGYEDEIWGTLPGEFVEESVSRLERKRLPKDIVVVDHEFMRNRNK